MPHLNLAATIAQIDFSPDIWEWIDLLEGVLLVQQEASLAADNKGFRADTDYKKVLVAGLHNARNAVDAIYLLLRFELVHQAAAQVRLFCEGLITLHYISIDAEARARQYWEYAYVEAFEKAEILLHWESATARSEDVEHLKQLRDSLKPDYERLKPRYLFTDKKGKQRPFINWANKSIADQAGKRGSPIERLYSLVYKTMSAYVHGSGWSIRKTGAYTSQHYDAQIVLVDFAEIVRMTVAIWIELAGFCRSQLGWRMADHAPRFAQEVRRLDAKYSANHAATGGAV